MSSVLLVLMRSCQPITAGDNCVVSQYFDFAKARRVVKSRRERGSNIPASGPRAGATSGDGGLSMGKRGGEALSRRQLYWHVKQTHCFHNTSPLQATTIHLIPTDNELPTMAQDPRALLQKVAYQRSALKEQLTD